MRPKLTIADAIQIRVLARRGTSQVELARRFGTTESNITAIIQRKTHSVSHITEALQRRRNRWRPKQ
jgi:transcriptional regulator